jgi:hypothetical protein
MSLLVPIMHVFGWTDCWYAHPGPTLDKETLKAWKSIASDPEYRFVGALRLWWVGHKNRWMVGVWTGPDYDLICVRHCYTKEEAERWLSPGGTTPEIAALKSVWKRLALQDTFRWFSMPVGWFPINTFAKQRKCTKQP